MPWDEKLRANLGRAEKERVLLQLSRRRPLGGGGRRRNNSTIGIRTEGELRGMANHGCHFQQDHLPTLITLMAS